MNVSEQWLRQWVNPTISVQEIADRLTMAGLEVDAIESATPDFHSVVVGLIESIETHPDAKKLRVCQVSDGQSLTQVVCGAANAAVGLRVPFAKVGAELPGGLNIKAAELRGVASSGMLCGASELGLEDVVDGLLVLPDDAPLGEDLRTFLSLDDTVIEVDLTPNRSDCLSMKGIARELGVLCQQDVSCPAIDAVDAQHDAVVPITIKADEACTRYVGRIIKGIQQGVETPLWMREILRRAGLRSIDPVVDVSNYVMLELGQPMHAFDLEKLSGGIEVRLAQQDEMLTFLDGSDIKLDDDMLVIADQKRALALAGVMGGQHSAVSDSSKDILLEAAYFAPEAIAGRARRLGLHTDSSHRFERGVDYALAEQAIERATQLLLSIVGGEAGPSVTVSTEHMPTASTINLRRAQIQRLLGFSIPDERVDDILQRLGLLPERNDEGWHCTVPSYRFDLAIEADLLEELARIYGYDALPVSPLTTDLAFSEVPESSLPINTIKQGLLARGFQEVITYSFIDPALASAMEEKESAVALKNPISSDMAVMRTSLLPGLVTTAQYNINRQQQRLRLFETGLRFVQQGSNLLQEPMLAGLLFGRRFPVNWSHDASAVDFYDLKAEVEAVLQQQGGRKALDGLTWSRCEHVALHPGQAADIHRNGEFIGRMGQLHPKVQHILGLDQPIYLFELCQNLISTKKVPEFKELSKFPEVKRDLAFIADLETSAGDIVNSIREVSGEYLVDVVIFDRYHGERIDSDKQSIAVSLTWQHPEQTLNEKEVNQLTDNVVSTLTQRLNLSLRS